MSELVLPINHFVGEAAVLGRRQGELAGEDIRRQVADMLGGWRERGLTAADLRERRRPFERFAECFAPYWLDEAAGLAAVTEVDEGELLAYLAGKYRELFFVEDCTSFAAVGSATADGRTLFHKNRDNAARNQACWYKSVTDSSGPAGFCTVGDTSDLGPMMMVNDHGLAGSADMGGLDETRPRGRGVMNPYILRLIAERAERCEDALEIIQQMIRDEWYAGGAKTGTHWLFADRFGRALRVAQNAEREEHWLVEDEIVFLARGETEGAALVTGRRGQVTVTDMQAAATHPTICFTSSISGLTVQIDPRQPARLTTAWPALPAWSPAMPVYLAARTVPLVLANGDFYRAGETLLARREDNAALFGAGMVLPEELTTSRRGLQLELQAAAAGTESRLREALEQGPAAEAAELAVNGMASASEQVMAWLAEANS